jgi:hypothetical protein
MSNWSLSALSSLVFDRSWLFMEANSLLAQASPKTPATTSRHFSQGIDLMAGGGAKPAGRAINRLEIGLAIGSASTRRG